MSNRIEKFLIISFSIVNNLCHQNAPKSPAENGISQTSPDTSLDYSKIFKVGRWFNCNWRKYGVKSGNKKGAINSANTLAHLDKA